jgi:ketopantoate hydroxymethyltransferase
MASKYIPKKDDKVDVLGHNGAFTVIEVDEQSRTASVRLASGNGPVMSAIPFGAIHKIREDVNQAAARVVREATKD